MSRRKVKFADNMEGIAFLLANVKTADEWREEWRKEDMEEKECGESKSGRWELRTSVILSSLNSRGNREDSGDDSLAKISREMGREEIG